MNKYNLNYLEEFNSIIHNSDYFLKKKGNSKGKKRKNINHYIYNQLCSCIVRIRETTQFLETYNFQKDNNMNQAFDFYAFITYVAIIEESVYILFNKFNLDITKEFKSKSCFAISNKTRQNDIKFFKFVRSATCIHPSETSLHKEIVKHEIEFYPYVSWISEDYDAIIYKDKSKDADLIMTSWNSDPKCYNKHYYLKSSEFIVFINKLLEIIKKVNEKAIELGNNYDNKLNCKRLKNEKSFVNFSDYCIYLNKRFKIRTNEKYIDNGGLIIASHIVKINYWMIPLRNI